MHCPDYPSWPAVTWEQEHTSEYPPQINEMAMKKYLWWLMEGRQITGTERRKSSYQRDVQVKSKAYIISGVYVTKNVRLWKNGGKTLLSKLSKFIYMYFVSWFDYYYYQLT